MKWTYLLVIGLLHAVAAPSWAVCDAAQIFPMDGTDDFFFLSNRDYPELSGYYQRNLSLGFHDRDSSCGTNAGATLCFSGSYIYELEGSSPPIYLYNIEGTVGNYTSLLVISDTICEKDLSLVFAYSDENPIIQLGDALWAVIESNSAIKWRDNTGLELTDTTDICMVFNNAAGPSGRCNDLDGDGSIDDGHGFIEMSIVRTDDPISPSAEFAVEFSVQVSDIDVTSVTLSTPQAAFPLMLAGALWENAFEYTTLAAMKTALEGPFTVSVVGGPRASVETFDFDASSLSDGDFFQAPTIVNPLTGASGVRPILRSTVAK